MLTRPCCGVLPDSLVILCLFCAFLSLRAQAGFDPDGLGAPARTKVVALRLREEPIFDRIRCEPGRVTPGVKKTTLWSARAGLDARDWEARYREHAKLVPSAHATAWRYRQNVIEAAPDGVPYDAVSELWWPSDEGLLEDFYASEQARCLVAEDTRGFIDVASAVQIVSRHERLC